MISVTCYLHIWLPNERKKQRKEGIKSMMKFIFDRQKTVIFSYNSFTPSVSIYLCIFIFIKKLQTSWYSLRKVKQSCDVQSVPKVCSSNFMHYNFWSKLYFYMKLLGDVYFSIKNMYSEFQLLACPFCFFLSHSVAVEAWIGIQHVDPQMIHFELFHHLVRRIQFNPQTKFV